MQPDPSSAGGNAVLELAGWTACVDSYLSAAGDAFGDRAAQGAGTDLIRDLRLSHNVLQRCSRLVLEASLSDDARIPSTVCRWRKCLSSGGASRTPTAGGKPPECGICSGLRNGRRGAERLSAGRRRSRHTPNLSPLRKAAGTSTFRRRCSGPYWAPRAPVAEFAVILPRFWRILRLLDIVGLNAGDGRTAKAVAPAVFTYQPDDAGADTLS